jgi:hypothetical protein
MFAFISRARSTLNALNRLLRNNELDTFVYNIIAHIVKTVILSTYRKSITLLASLNKKTEPHTQRMTTGY